MSGTRLVWISFSLTDSLNVRCGSRFDDAITLPDWEGYNAAEGVYLNQIHWPDTSGIMSGSGRMKVRTTDMAVISQKLLVCGILTPFSCVRMVTGHSPAKGNSPGPSVDVIEGLRRWLLIWSLAHPHSLASDGMATATVRLALECMRTCHWFCIGIVMVGRHVNLWCSYTMVRLAQRHSDHERQMLPTTEPYESEKSKLMSWSAIRYVRVWRDSYQKCNTLIPHWHEHDNLAEFVAISTMCIHLECKSQRMLLSNSWKMKYRCACVTSRAVSINRSHCSSKEKNKV
jgi:hypothetical protein